MTSLSVATLTHVDPAMLAARFRNLRDVADEIVVAYDSRFWPDDLSALDGVADRVVPCHVAGPVEPHLEWLVGLCRCEWVLRLDGDEIASRALLAVLGDRAWDCDVDGISIGRRWLWPTPARWLADAPWWPDAQLRLTRNDPDVLVFPTAIHEPLAVTGPSRFLVEAIYHLDLLVTSTDARRRKALTYLRAQPTLRTAGGLQMTAYYLPESCRRAARTEPVDEADLADIVDGVGSCPRRVVEGTEVPGRSGPPVEAGRSDGLAVLNPPLTALAGSTVELVVTERPGAAVSPDVRLGARWEAGDGRTIGAEARAPVPGAGSARHDTVVLNVPVPSEPGTHRLVVDTLREGVGWHRRGVTLTITVREQPTIVLVDAHPGHRLPADHPVVRTVVEELASTAPEIEVQASVDDPVTGTWIPIPAGSRRVAAEATPTTEIP